MNYRNTYTQIDLDAIRHNFRSVRERVGEKTAVLAVVKADAYGHGAVRVSRALLREGAGMLGVAIPEEGEALRADGIGADILVLSGTNAAGAAADVRLGLIQTVYSEECVRILESACEKEGKTARVHVKLDTGMGRIGVRNPEELKKLLSCLARAKHLEVCGAYTHFADADSEDDGYRKEQLSRFLEMKRDLPSGIVLHAAASAALARMPEARFDMVRAGIVLYGCPPCEGYPDKLENAMRFVSEVVHVKEIGPGESIGYGRKFLADRKTRVATVAVGYGDGYPRILSGKAQVLIRGKRCRVLGNICMDALMADVSQVAEAARGDEAVLWGTQGDACIQPAEIARLAGTIDYEILLSPSGRVPRKYIDSEG